MLCELLKAITTESVLALADYKKWPFYSFLKCTQIRSMTIFNLKFYLTYVIKSVKVLAFFKVLRNSISMLA
jgi:hypothetical protein